MCGNYYSDRAAKDPSFTFTPIIVGAKNPQCRDPHVQSLVANFQLYASLLVGISSAIISPHLGALSDRIGRRRIMAFATTGTFLLEVITIIVGTHPDTISVYWILVGSLMDGLCGSFTTCMALSFAYASDCTAPDRRNVAFGLFHGTMFTGIALGPILAAYLIDVTGNVMIVFYVAVGCHLFFIFFLLCVIPESVSKERQLHAREKFKIKMQDPKYTTWTSTLLSYNIFEPLWILRPKGEGSSPQLRKNLFLLAAVDTIMFGVAMGTVQIILIYAEYEFGWTAVDSSKFLSAVNICRVLALVIILPLVTRLVRGPRKDQAAGEHHGSDLLDVNVIRIAVFFDLVGYIGYATVRTGGLMAVSGAVASLGGIGSPTLQSSLTKHIPSDRTGQMLGASGLLHALARIIAPTIFNLIYSKTVGNFTQAVFVCLASVFGVAFIMTWFLRPNGKTSGFERKACTDTNAVYLDEPPHEALDDD